MLYISERADQIALSYPITSVYSLIPAPGSPHLAVDITDAPLADFASNILVCRAFPINSAW